jgi:hypothetical protein
LLSFLKYSFYPSFSVFKLSFSYLNSLSSEVQLKFASSQAFPNHSVPQERKGGRKGKRKKDGWMEGEY